MHNAAVTTEQVQRLAGELGLDAVGVTRAEAYTSTERHIRERRARGLFGRMRFTMARPEVSCHPETLLDGARTVVSAALCYYAPEPERPRGSRPAAAVHLARPLRRPPREARRARPRLALAGRRVPRARRREPARRPRGGRSLGRRLLRQEHDGADAPARLLGRARHARHDRRARADAAARPRLRLVHALHRRVPDRRARRAGRARRDALPLVLDAGARADAGALPRRARRAGLRLRHLPGRLPVEPRRRSGGARSSSPTPRRTSISSRGSRPTGASSSPTLDRLYVPRNDPRWLRRNALVALGNVGEDEPRTRDALRRYAEGDDELLAEHARWAELAPGGALPVSAADDALREELEELRRARHPPRRVRRDPRPRRAHAARVDHRLRADPPAPRLGPVAGAARAASGGDRPRGRPPREPPRRGVRHRAHRDRHVHVRRSPRSISRSSCARRWPRRVRAARPSSCATCSPAPRERRRRPAPAAALEPDRQRGQVLAAGGNGRSDAPRR